MTFCDTSAGNGASFRTHRHIDLEPEKGTDGQTHEENETNKIFTSNSMFFFK